MINSAFTFILRFTIDVEWDSARLRDKVYETFRFYRKNLITSFQIERFHFHQTFEITWKGSIDHIFIHNRSSKSTLWSWTSHNLQPQATQNSSQKKWAFMNIKRKYVLKLPSVGKSSLFEKRKQRVSTMVTITIRKWYQTTELDNELSTPFTSLISRGVCTFKL